MDNATPNVKADSKGRLAGGNPEMKYTRKTHPNGKIEYVPEVPNEFDAMREVGWHQFTSFFGATPDEVLKDGIRLVDYNSKEGEFLPTGFMVTKFVTTPQGSRVYEGGESLKERVFIRVGKEG